MLNLFFKFVKELLFQISPLFLLFILLTSRHGLFLSSIDKGHLKLSHFVLVVSVDEVNVELFL